MILSNNLDPNSSKAKPVNEERDISDKGVKDDDRTRGVWLQVYHPPYTMFDMYYCARPVLVTFEDFSDRCNVLRKAGMLKGSNIHVTEDMSR